MDQDQLKKKYPAEIYSDGFQAGYAEGVRDSASGKCKLCKACAYCQLDELDECDSLQKSRPLELLNNISLKAALPSSVIEASDGIVMLWRPQSLQISFLFDGAVMIHADGKRHELSPSSWLGDCLGAIAKLKP